MFAMLNIYNMRDMEWFSFSDYGEAFRVVKSSCYKFVNIAWGCSTVQEASLWSKSGGCFVSLLLYIV